MPTHEDMVAAVKAYVDAFAQENLNAIVNLYADDATVEDPVGSPLHSGAEAIRAFYAKAVEMRAKLTLNGPVRTAGNTAAFAFTVDVPNEGAVLQIDVIDTFRFDERGRVSRMRAYWGPHNVRQGGST